MKNLSQNQIKLEIDPEFAGQRLDVYLSNLLDDFSRSHIQQLIDDNHALVNGKYPKRAYKLKEGDLLELTIPEEKPITLDPENIPLEFVYQDEHLAVINKPSGLLTHPAPGQYSGTLVNALLYHCKDTLSGINGYLRPGIIHRLDKDTSGLILIAKNDRAHQHLSKQIQDRTVDKYYLTVVQSNLKEDSGIIDAPIGRHPVKREKMAVVENGKEAITKWKVLERFQKATFVEAKLITGRTHQIRVHFSHIKHPVIGDPVYGDTRYQNIKLERQALQAYKISFIHPGSCEKLTFKIDFNDDIKKILRIFNSQYINGEKNL